MLCIQKTDSSSWNKKLPFQWQNDPSFGYLIEWLDTGVGLRKRFNWDSLKISRPRYLLGNLGEFIPKDKTEIASLCSQWHTPRDCFAKLAITNGGGHKVSNGDGLSVVSGQLLRSEKSPTLPAHPAITPLQHSANLKKPFRGCVCGINRGFVKFKGYCYDDNNSKTQIDKSWDLANWLFFEVAESRSD